ncbi:MAG: hypothetical protein OEZ30_07140 [Candidatus Aminicenantes bacterium]|nr:hypothetical protein [Candidatus Aminicenantes bacterium]
MGKRNCFMVFVFLVSILAASALLFGQRVIDLNQVWGDIRVLGEDVGDRLGSSVAYGDINDDGYMDLIIGAPEFDPVGRSKAGAVYVIFGSSDPLQSIDLSSLSVDITIYGYNSFDVLGYAVASGDINDDGYDDIIIGAPEADPGDRTDAGTTYVIFGGDFPSPPYIKDLAQAPADMTIYGDEEYDWFGGALASGNINGDDYDDLIIGAQGCNPPGGGNAGATYVIIGSSSPPTTIDLSTESAHIHIMGDDELDCCGRSVASGNVNDDAYDDIIIGACSADAPGGTNSGEAYVIFGASYPSPPYSIDLDSVSPDILIYGDNPHDMCGGAVASGDINGDGYDDIIIGAVGCDSPGGGEAGATYVVFGESFASPPYTIDFDIEAADMSIHGAAALDCSGFAVASGDVNHDGFHDVITGAPNASPPGGKANGKSYVIFGASSPPASIDLSTQWADITLNGDDDNDEFGSALASGDINGDGFDDLITGAPKADPPGGPQAGEAYLILGGGAITTAHGLDGTSWIKAFSHIGRDWGSFKAFGAVNSRGEVQLAVGDVDMDVHDEIIAGHGEGGKSWVKLFEVNAYLINNFKAFGAANTNGEVHLAIGNFDATLSDMEIAVSQGEGGQSWIKVFEADGTYVRAFKAFGAANGQGEVHLAAADLENADGIDEIIAGMGEGGSSWVKIFTYDGTIIRSFRAFDATENPGGEVHLAVGNFDGDADIEIAAATGYNGGNKVKMFDKDGTLIKGFFPFGAGSNPNREVQIAAADIDNDGMWELICGHGEGGDSWVKLFKADATFIRTFKAFGGVNVEGEVHLGKTNY